MTPELEFHGYRWVQTSIACPEQYDIFDRNGRQVGYFRVRHGVVRVYAPDADGVELLSELSRGDGCLDNDERREFFDKALTAIEDHLAISVA